MTAIVKINHPALRQIAKAVDPKTIGTAELNDILKKMSVALLACDDGVALAAPQIGLPLRIFIVSHRLFDDNDTKDIVFINPEITRLAKTKVILDEGCLSVPGSYGKTKRAPKATVTALDETGRRFTWSGTGLMAQIFQHETDHLNGILFSDHATDLKNHFPDEPKK